MSEQQVKERKEMNQMLKAAAQFREDELSTHPTLNKFLKHGYQLKVWDDRYSAGIWVALGRDYSQEFSEVCELTESGDIEAAGFSEYILNTGAWLPFNCNVTILAALDDLEKKLSQLPCEQIERSSDWAKCYDLALKNIIENADGNYGIADAIDAGKLPSTPFKQ